MAKSYRSQYLDPRWQKKRLEVMQERHFTCEICYAKDQTLNVHHKQYISNKDVWDYENCQLSVICQDCHKQLHEQPDFINEVISRIPQEPGFRSDAAFILAGYFGMDVNNLIKSSNDKLAYRIGEQSRELQHISHAFYVERKREAE